MTIANPEVQPDVRELLEQERKLRAAADEQNRKLSQDLLRAEQERQELINLYVASRRLQVSLDRADVLAGIQEIVINLIGSEELGVFEVSEDRQSLCLISAFGLESASWEPIPRGQGPIGEAAERGEPTMAGPRDASHLTAVIPLKVDGKLIGALAVFRLLPQKGALSANDRDLFELLATHGAVALLSSSHARGGVSQV